MPLLETLEHANHDKALGSTISYLDSQNERGYALQILDSFYTFTIEIAAVDLFFNILYPSIPTRGSDCTRWRFTGNGKFDF